MERNIISYVRHHAVLVTIVVFGTFILLATGELYLYRNEMKLNRMIAEGLMQIKESNKQAMIVTTLANGIMMKNSRMIFIKNGIATILDKNTLLPDGMKIMLNGQIIWKDGRMIILKEGQVMAL